MAKIGIPYEGLVGLVAAALHPTASIEVGEWVEGPDGAREIDVSVRGEIEGKHAFILIECKDWKKDVGIAEIDALDSKRGDVGADKTIIVSNSGFTKPALLKAQRVGIMCFSALVHGSDIVRFVLYREFVAKKLSVERCKWRLYSDSPNGIEVQLDELLEYDSKKFVAWLRDHSVQLLRDNEFARIIHCSIVFKQPLELTRLGQPYALKAIEFNLERRQYLVTQTIQEDVSHGMYDHIKQQLLIPDREFWIMKFDGRNRQEVEIENEADVLAHPPDGGVKLAMNLYNPIFIDSGPSPEIDGLVDKANVRVILDGAATLENCGD